MKIKFQIFAILFSFLCFPLHAQWVMTWYNHFFNVTDLIATDSCVYVSYQQAGVFLSRDNGDTPIPIREGLPGLMDVTCLEINNNNIYAGNLRDGIYKSTNNGNSWFSINDSNTAQLLIFKIHKFSNTMLIATNHGIFKSINEGQNWVLISDNLPFISAMSIFSKDNVIFSSGSNSGVFKSTNLGDTWSKCTNGIPDSCGIKDYVILNGNIFVSLGPKGIYKSSDTGNSWIVSENHFQCNSISTSSNLLLAENMQNCFVSSDNGLVWNLISNVGINGNFFDISKMDANSQYTFAGTYGNGVWRKSISEIININLISSNVPESMHLFQNYPNPFNPNTNIKLEIKKKEFTQLIVYNSLGNEVSRLVNQVLEPGSYSIIFDGSNLSSGIYYCKMQTNNFFDVKKMILMK